MDIEIPNGKYIVAVSGGVDSMVLLDLLRKKAGTEIIVAHLNHGIREDSKIDENLVAKTADAFGLSFEAGRADLGPNASEETARMVRYEFLEEVKKKHKADAIITAHHRDDLLETAIINTLRGTGPSGLVAMADNPKVLRPLLRYTKADILNYAQKHRIVWREDRSNQDTRYLRNYIRQKLIPKLSVRQKHEILDRIEDVAQKSGEKNRLIEEIDLEVAGRGQIDRAKFINLPIEVGREILAYWLRKQDVRDFDKATINRLLMALKTAKPGTRHNVANSLWLKIEKDFASFENNR